MPTTAPQDHGHLPSGALSTVRLGGMDVCAATEREVVASVQEAWEAGRGGLIVTANIDILRRIAREPLVRALAQSSDIVTADGMPLVWASALAGRRLPERVTGASLFWSLGEAAATRGRSVFVLGGPPGAADQAAAALALRFPGLVIAGTACPPRGFENSATEMEGLIADVVASGAGLVLVGLGFPKQELLSAQLRQHLPTAWYLGCGAAVVFAAGKTARAPRWMQRSGLEWLHRLAQEPGRLAGRYLRDDVPFAVALLATAAVARIGLTRPAARTTSDAAAGAGRAR